jgi:hypothetical protein
MKTLQALRSLTIGVAAMFAATLAHADVTTSYNLNLNPGTSAGNPVTNIMILEANANGSQLLIDYAGSPNGFNVSGAGFSTLTHTSAFAPAMSLIIGLTQQVDKISLVIFMSDAFAAQAAGTNFNPNFFSITHNAFIARVLAAETGSQSDLNWFRDVFFPIDGSRMAFQTGGSSTAMEFTVGVVIGQVPEQANTALLLALSCGMVFVARRFGSTRRA